MRIFLLLLVSSFHLSGYDFDHPKHKARINFLNDCDGVIHNRPEIKEFINIEKELNVPMQFIAQPHNVEYFHKHYFSEKELALYEYIPNHPPRHGTTQAFCEYMNKKHNIKFNWIKGHNNHPQNERCDELAVKAAKNNSTEHDIYYEKLSKNVN